MTILLYLKAFQSLLIPFIIGYSVLMLLFKDMRLPLRLLFPLSYGLGMGLLTHWMLIIGIFKIPYSLKTISAPLIFISILFVYFSRRFRSKEVKQIGLAPSKSLTRGQMILFTLGISYIIYMTISVFWRSFNLPLKDWDAVSFIGYKAMVFFYEKALYQHADLPHASYPLHTSLAETWVAFNLNQWHHVLVKAIFPAYFLSLISLVYIFLRSWTSRLTAVFGVVLILSSNILTYHAAIGYKDFVVMFYSCSVFMLLMLWQKHKQSGFLITSALLAGFGSFVKNEAALYLVIYYFVFLFILFLEKNLNILEKLKNLLIYFFISLGICGIYQVYRLAAGITIKTYNTNLGFDISHLQRIPGIIIMLANNLFTSAGWNFVWFLFFLSLLQYKKIIKHPSLCTIVLSVFSFLGLYAVGLLLSPQYDFFKEVSQHTVLSRVVLHFFPLSALAIVLINGIEDEGNDDLAQSS